MCGPTHPQTQSSKSPVGCFIVAIVVLLIAGGSIFTVMTDGAYEEEIGGGVLIAVFAGINIVLYALRKRQRFETRIWYSLKPPDNKGGAA